MIGEIEYNTCDTCGASDGRAGMLMRSPGGPNECMNCRDTRITGDVCIHFNLPRTEEELAKTMAILDKVE